jgi:putative SOS response-associated peptidase YedK
LLPADGYFEWEKRDDKKIPHYLHGDGVLAMAGLYELWRDPTKADDDPARWLWTCTVITTDAEDDLGRIHDRMPLMLTPDKYDAWLDPGNQDRDALLGLLQPAAPGLLEDYPVSTLVSRVDNNGPELDEPNRLEGA